eukprot:6896750-Prymnesium_polylepis.3
MFALHVTYPARQGALQHSRDTRPALCAAAINRPRSSAASPACPPRRRHARAAATRARRPRARPSPRTPPERGRTRRRRRHRH